MLYGGTALVTAAFLFYLYMDKSGDVYRDIAIICSYPFVMLGCTLLIQQAHAQALAAPSLLDGAESSPPPAHMYP